MRKQEFNSKLISLLPLDEVPVHVHRFAARAPCDSKGSECQCGIHRAEAASALRSRKTERAAKEKTTPISQIFFSTCSASNSPPRPGEAPHPAPSARKSATQTAQKTALCAPCEHPGGSESENRPATRGTAHSEVQGDDRGTARCTTRCNVRPIAALHFLLPTGDSRSGRRSLIPNSSPFSRSTRFPFTSTASPPAPLAIRKTPSGRRGKSRRQSHTFFLAPAAPETIPRLGEETLPRAALGHAYALAGKRAEAQRVLDDLLALSKQRFVSPYDISLVHLGLGEKDKAFEWLQKAVAERVGLLVYLKVDPLFDPLRSDPRFQDLLRRMGLPP